MDSVPCQESETLQVSQFSSVIQLCPTLCNPMDRSTPGLPVHHQLTEFTYLHWLISIESVMPSSHPSSVVPLSSCLQSFPASGSFPVSQFFISGGQRIGVSASSSVLPMNIQDWFPLGLTFRIDWWLTVSSVILACNSLFWYLCLVLVSAWWSHILIFIVTISLLFFVALYMHALLLNHFSRVWLCVTP